MSSWTSGICEAGSARIHYLRTAGARPPLVLLHGLTANGNCWRPLARTLEDDFDVVMPDARGHGRSSAPLNGYGYDDHASDVVALIRGLGLCTPVLLGHSMGGMTALVVASRIGAVIRGVILADPTFLSPERQREVRASDVIEQHRRMLRLSREELVSEARVRHPHRSPETLELLAEARLQTQIQAFDVLTPPNPDYRNLVATIHVPVLLVIGDVGGVVSLQAATQLQALNPHLRVEQIRNAGHGLLYDQPGRFEELVRSFLSSLQPKSGLGA